jgi:hypothetical protein
VISTKRTPASGRRRAMRHWRAEFSEALLSIP